MSIIAQTEDRLDRIAYRVYGNIADDTLRTLIWANPDLPIVIPAGTVVETPDVQSFTFGSVYQPILPGIQFDLEGHVVPPV